MKYSTTQLFKFKKLKRRLGLSEFEAIGLLEALWHCTAANCQRGDIGQLSDEDIAAAIEWDRDPEELVEALLAYGWLDACDTHRLVVHDWHEHCPNFIKGNLAKHDKQFAIAACSEQRANSRLPKQAAQGSLPPILSNPILSKPRREKNKVASDFSPPTLDAVSEYVQQRKSSVDPVAFHAHYSANGWHQSGGAKLTSWKSAVIAWERNSLGRERAAEQQQEQAVETAKKKRRQFTAENARYQLVKNGVGEARDWPAERCLAEFFQRQDEKDLNEGGRSG